jgi:hypothetical protein
LVPSKLITGDTFVAEFNYEAPVGFTLSFRINGPQGEDAETRTYTVDASTNKATIAASDTENFLAGKYNWVLIQTDGTVVNSVDSGYFIAEVRADLQVNQQKSHARKVLEAIEAVLENRATHEQQSYSIKDRSLSRHSLPDLIELRKYYADLVRREEGKGLTRQIKPKFGRY